MFHIYFGVFVFATFVASSHQSEGLEEVTSKISGNEIFDSLIKDIQSNVNGVKKFEAIPTPDLKEELQAHVMMVPVIASLTATKGVLSNLTSLRRTSDVKNRTVGKTMFFTAAVTLDDLQVVFHHYNLQMGVLHKTGDRVALYVGKNSFLATLKYYSDGLDCPLTLEYLAVSELSDMHVDISGFSIFTFLGRHVVSWFVDYFQDLILKITDNYGKEMVNCVIKGNNICEKIRENKNWTAQSVTSARPLSESFTTASSTTASLEPTTTEDDFLPDPFGISEVKSPNFPQSPDLQDSE